MDKVLEKLKEHFILIIVGLVLVISNQAWSYIQQGAKQDINKVIDARIKEKIQDSQLIQVLLESEQVSKFTEEAGHSIRNKIIEDVTKTDSNKISLNAFIGKELGVRDEAVLPLLRDLLKDYKEGKLNAPRRNPNILEL